MLLEKGDIIECSVDDMGMYGEGIAHVEGLTVFIPGAVTGEIVRAKTVLVKKSLAHALLIGLIKPSPYRITPPCPYFKRCGGCALQHVDYTFQLEIKRRQAAGCLKKTAGYSGETEETVPSPKPYGYRNKLSLPVRDAGGRLAFGFFEKRSHRLVEAADCLLQAPGTFALAAEGVRWASAAGLTGYDENTKRGELRHVVVRSVGGTKTLTLVLNGRSGDFKDKLSASEQYMPEGAEIFLNYNDRPVNVILGDATLNVTKVEANCETAGHRLPLHPKAFFQVNDGVREMLYSEVVKEVSGRAVVDAYSGAGALSLLLSRAAASVTAVEISKEAVESARLLKEREKAANLTLLCGDCAELMSRAVEQAVGSSGSGGAAVVLDPPKAGCDERVLSALTAEPKVDKVIYVSCNPATLARDAAILIKSGFSLVKVKPFDMFPQTMSVETLAVMERKGAGEQTALT